MARGKSGRIVLEVDPLLKRKLYLALEKNETTLKDWFLQTANIYISDNISPFIYENTFVAEDNKNDYSIERENK